MRSTCGGCGAVFSSVGTFDIHRVGNFAAKERRCLTVSEMFDAGLVLKDDVWRQAPSESMLVFAAKQKEIRLAHVG